MALYITRGTYTGEAIRGLMAKPEDRTEEVSKLIASVGGRLHALYYTFGEYDFLMITEAPSEKEVISALLAGAAGGTVVNLNTTVAVTASEMKQCFAKAATLAPKFRPAGK